MTTTTILVTLLAMLGIIVTGGMTIAKLNDLNFKDTFISALDNFLNLVDNDTALQTKFKNTYKMIVQYKDLGKTLTDLRLAIMQPIVSAKVTSVVVAVWIWLVFKEFCKAIAQGLISLTVKTDVTAISSELIVTSGLFDNYAEFEANASRNFTLVKLIEKLISDGVPVIAMRTFYGTALQNSTRYGTGYYDYKFIYPTDGATKLTFTYGDYSFDYYKPISIDYKAEFFPYTSSPASASYTWIVRNADTLENVTRSWCGFSLIPENAGGYNTLAEVYPYLHKIASGNNYSTLTPTNAGTYYYIATGFVNGWYDKLDDVTGYVDTLVTIDNGVVVSGEVEQTFKPFGTVYEKVLDVDDTGALGDVVTGGRVFDDNGVIEGPVSVTIDDTFVETYPDISALLQSLADALANINVYPYVDTDQLVISGTIANEDTLSDTDTAQDTLENLNQNPNISTPVIVPPPTIGISESGMIAIFNPTLSEVSQLNDILWSEDIITNFRKAISDPVEAIISFHAVPIQPLTSGRVNVKLGNYDSGISMRKLSSQFGTFSCGSVKITPTFENYMDYMPYTKVSLYLPFVGFVDLDTNEVMNADVSVNYNIDFLTGSCLAQVSIGKVGLNTVGYQFSGNMGMELPVTSSNYTQFYSSMIGVVGAVIGGGLTGGLMGALGGLSVGGIMNTALASGGNVQHSGGLTGNSGFLGDFTPYIIVTLPRPNNPTNYNSLEGYVVNDNVRLGDLSGYTKVSDVILNGFSCTNVELEMIESLLKSGVIM